MLVFSNSGVMAKDPDKITAAKVDNYIISAQDVLDALNKLPQRIKEKPLSDSYLNIVNELINQHLITKIAYKEKLDLNENVVSLLKKNKDQILARYWLNNFLSKQINKETIDKYYNNYTKDFKTFKEFNASHILVKGKKEAFDIIEKLKNKSKFSELANKYSIGPSGKNDGKLGWFQSGQMVKDFEKAVFALKEGEITNVPVKTQFGYHIIMLNGVRNASPKPLNEVEQNIIDSIKKLSLSKLEKNIRKDRNITINEFEKVAKEVNN